MRVADIPVDFRLWDKRSHRIHDNHIHGPTPHQNLNNFKGLLAKIRLRNKQIVYIDSKPAGIVDIKRMFRIDKGRDPV